VKRPVVRSAIALGVLVFATILALPAAARPGLTAESFRQLGNAQHVSKAASTRLARTDRSLLRLRGSKPVKVMVKLDYDSVASYRGGVAGLAATSPLTPGRSLRSNAAAVARYSDYIVRRERDAVAAIRSAIPGADVYGRYRLAYGGIAVRVRSDRIGRLLRIPGIVAVQRDHLEQPQTSVTPQFLGAPDVWKSLGGQNVAGENVIVGVLDTGVWPENPGFRDPGIDPAPGDFQCEFGDGSRLFGPTFECNDKLIGAHAMVRTYMRFVGALPGEFCDNRTLECSARDADGHGTHTSTTAAGSPVESAPILGIDRGPISGVAPGAHVIAYRVCLDQGCFNSDSIRAVQRGIRDGIDVINYSIGGGDAYTDPVEVAFLDAYAAGISVNVSAGNSGPGAQTAEHGGPWVTTVGASTSPRWFMTTLYVSNRDGDTFHVRGATLTHGIRSTRVVMAEDLPGYDDPTCVKRIPDAVAEGLIVACERTVNRILKSHVVQRAGGVGMILYNVGNEDLFTDSHYVPTVHIEGPRDTNRFLAFMEAAGRAEAHWRTGQPTAVRPDVMTTFSSRGPLGDFIKPDVTAPGLQIVAGDTPEGVTPLSGPDGENFQAIAGTSMSSPHSAGVSALVKAAHPDWTPGQIKSALMTSAVQDVLKEDGRTPADPFDMGAGSIRANRAVDTALTFDVSAEAYAASGADPLSRIHLNLPSINAPVMPGSVATTRTATNVSGETLSFEVSTSATGGEIRVQPSAFSLGAGESQELRITIDGGSRLARSQYFGRIAIHPDGDHPDAVLPVAFAQGQGDVRLHHRCNRRNVQLGGGARCTATVNNLSGAAARATLDVEGPDPRNLEITDVSDPGTQTGNGFTASGRLSGAVPPPIQAITPGGTGLGYVSLGDLGAEPIPDMSDESIANFEVTPYLYGHQRYDEIGVTSNGYAVVGGGGATDVDFVPQDLPNPAPPNNVLAPFWTDLDPGSGGSMYLAELTDDASGTSWIVAEWADVPTFGTDDLQTFQIWIQTSGGVEANSFAYGRLTGAGDPSVGLTVGAENYDGTSGVSLGAVPQEGDEYTIETGQPIPGGALTVTYRVIGHRAGEYDLVAEMTSDLTLGTARRVHHISVLAIP
jgi:subtilisin family serine protease